MCVCVCIYNVYYHNISECVFIFSKEEKSFGSYATYYYAFFVEARESGAYSQDEIMKQARSQCYEYLPQGSKLFKEFIDRGYQITEVRKKVLETNTFQDQRTLYFYMK